MIIIDRFADEHWYLSNFWKVPILVDIEYPSVEHAYAAMKTENKALRAQIAAAPRPGTAKWMGRKLARPLRPGWEKGLRVEVMNHLIRRKFAPNTLLAKALLNTGDAYLIEGNSHGDRFWGMTPYYPDKDVIHEGDKLIPGNLGITWLGKNNLGNILMVVRSELNA